MRLALIVLLAGCWGGRGWVEEDTGRWWDSGAVDVDTSTLDTGETDLGHTGGLSVAYTFAGAVGCDETGLDSLALRVVGNGDDVVYACSDEPLRLFDLYEQTWRVVVVGESADGLLWRSDPTYVTILADEVVDVAVELTCVDDGSGGCPTGETE